MGHSSCRWARGVVLALGTTIGMATAAFAQNCPQPDGLDGPAGACCQPAQTILPQFPTISQQMRYICWDNCNAQINANACVDIAAPVPVPQNGALVCGVYLIRYTIKTCGANQVLWSGSMRAQYSRTWAEASGAAGPDFQVWRFLLNGDLVPSAFLLSHFPNNQCVVAPCRAAFNNAIHTGGYIDYAFDCVNGRWQAAWALDHNCDLFEHAVGVSARPGNFHAFKSYTWLGPGGGFVVNPGQLAPSVGFQQGTIRKNQWIAVPQICLFREPVVQGAIDFTGRPSCVCGTTTAVNAQFIPTFTSGQGLCGSGWMLSPNAVIPFQQKRIGSWTNAAIFPGTEDLLLDEGHLNYVDGCIGTVSTQYFEGVETRGGFPPFTLTTPPTPLGQQFEDWASTNRTPNNPATLVGAPYISDYIINMIGP
jgi:hypothetical protein